MPDELKQLLKAGCLAVWIGSTLLGALWFFTLQKRFNDRVAEDVKDVGRSIALRNELANEARGYLEDGDIDGYQQVMDQGIERIKEQSRQQYEARKKRYPGMDWDAIEKRNGMERVTPDHVPEADRVEGAFYPGDHRPSQPVEDEGSSLVAAAGAAVGGLVIFLGVGFGAWRILGAALPSEEEVVPEEAIDGELVVVDGQGGPVAPDDFDDLDDFGSEPAEGTPPG